MFAWKIKCNMQLLAEESPSKDEIVLKQGVTDPISNS